MYLRPPSKGKHVLLNFTSPFLTLSLGPSRSLRRSHYTLRRFSSPPRPSPPPPFSFPPTSTSRDVSVPTSREWFDFLNSPVVDVEHRLAASECCRRRGDIVRAPPRTLIDAAQPLGCRVYRFSSAEQGNAGIVAPLPLPLRGGYLGTSFFL